ncbi:MAG: four helix bundle protein [Desulfurivibrionaceae bacterium]|nr:four helix bundle protein [Desulfobulbales bacterium]MDT8335215.1 four helix bundle protein [Desulfurivibrionaceae bacterium]
MKRSNEEFARELERRTRLFAVRIISLSGMLPMSPEGKMLRNQITKSGTSIGANYREVNRARSRAEFNSRIKICESEASETQYWLEVIREAAILTEHDVNICHRECTELLAIFTAIAKQKQ